MHLKSTNGAIDVLVCPEDEAQSSQCLQGTTNGLCAARSVCSVLDPPPRSPELVVSDDPIHSQLPQHPDQQQQQQQQQQQHQQPQQQELLQQQQQCPVGQLPVDQANSQPYPQVTVTGPTNELDISLSSAADVTDDLGFMERLLPLDVFDHLSSPTLHPEDFSFSMDNSTEGIHDLFDLWTPHVCLPEPMVPCSV